jgi:hypothetical protein
MPFDSASHARNQKPKKPVPPSLSDAEILAFLPPPGPESGALPESKLVKELFGIEGVAILKAYNSLKAEFERARESVQAAPSDAHRRAAREAFENLQAYLEDQGRLGLALQHWAASTDQQQDRLGTS